MESVWSYGQRPIDGVGSADGGGRSGDDAWEAIRLAVGVTVAKKC